MKHPPKARSQRFEYQVVRNVFQQSEGGDVGTFAQMPENFGLINQEYKTDSARSSVLLTDWQRFDRYVQWLNDSTPDDTSYHVLFIGRHGHGYHNALQEYYGTEEYHFHISSFDHDPVCTDIQISDAKLTSIGKTQAESIRQYWRRMIESEHTPIPESYYVSPLYRACETVNLQYVDLPRPSPTTVNHRHISEISDNNNIDGFIPTSFQPIILENLRETIGMQTCARRSTKSEIQRFWPNFRFEEDFTETDELFRIDKMESREFRLTRVRKALDKIFSLERQKHIQTQNQDRQDPIKNEERQKQDYETRTVQSKETDLESAQNAKEKEKKNSTYISITTHAGMMSSILTAINHQVNKLSTGIIIPVFLQVTQLSLSPSSSFPDPCARHDDDDDDDDDDKISMWRDETALNNMKNSPYATSSKKTAYKDLREYIAKEVDVVGERLEHHIRGKEKQDLNPSSTSTPTSTSHQRARVRETQNTVIEQEDGYGTNVVKDTDTNEIVTKTNSRETLNVVAGAGAGAGADVNVDRKDNTTQPHINSNQDANEASSRWALRVDENTTT